jgi:sugar-specific transcriptional regulator TrmB
MECYYLNQQKMIIKQELANKIRDYFDLNVYETKVWLALLGKGIASAGEVSTISGVPRSRTYDVLESLEKKGFAIEKLGKPVKYIGVKPKVILEKIKNNVKKEADDRINDLLKIRDTQEFEELESLYKEGANPIRREEVSASLRGKTNISNHLKEVLQNAEKEVVICTNAKEIASKFKLFEQTFERFQKANIKIKIGLSGDEKLVKQLSEKLNIKISPINIDAKFFIIDRREILFYLSKDSTEEDIAIWLNSDFFSEAFATLFESAIKQ